MANSVFETFINDELPRRIVATDTGGTALTGKIPVYTGSFLATSAKTPEELNLVVATGGKAASMTEVATSVGNGTSTNTLITASVIDELKTSVNNYTDTTVLGMWKDQGNYNVGSTTNWPTSANTIGSVAIKKGFLWVVAGAPASGTGTAKTLTGGIVVSNGDTIRAVVDAATNNAADWAVNEQNINYVPEKESNKVQDLSTPSAATFPSTQAVVDANAFKSNMDLTNDRIATGMTINTGALLTGTVGAGTAYVSGKLVSITSPVTITGLTAGASSTVFTTNYLDLSSSGEITKTTSTTTTAGCLRIGQLTADDTHTTGAGQYINLGVGAGSCRAITSGYANTGLGSGSGGSINSGTYNSLVGFNAGSALTTGAQNTIIGAIAGSSITSASGNTLIGYSTGSRITTGVGNVSIGGLHFLTTGFNNIGIGGGSGVGIQQGIEVGTPGTDISNCRSITDAYSIFIGTGASRDVSISNTTALSDIIAIGRGARVASSNTCIIGSTFTNLHIGINMVSATAWLHLPAGTTAAGTAPLKFTSGNALTTAEDGVMNYIASTDLTFTTGGSTPVRRRVCLSNSTVALSSLSIASGTPWQNTMAQDVQVLISGGTVTLTEFSRNGSNWFTWSSAASSVVWLSPQDSVRFTYTGSPVIKLIPR